VHIFSLSYNAAIAKNIYYFTLLYNNVMSFCLMFCCPLTLCIFCCPRAVYSFFLISNLHVCSFQYSAVLLQYYHPPINVALTPSNNIMSSNQNICLLAQNTFLLASCLISAVSLSLMLLSSCSTFCHSSRQYFDILLSNILPSLLSNILLYSFQIFYLSLSSVLVSFF
jgi:hypothetical protein